VRFVLGALIVAALLAGTVAALGDVGGGGAGDGDGVRGEAAGSGPAPEAAQTPDPPAPRVAVVWGADDIRAAAQRLARAPRVSGASVLERGTTLLRGARPGLAIPLDAVGVDPRGYASLVAERDRRAVGRLRPGRALLSETSARLRGRRSGDLRLAGGRRLRVIGVVGDATAQAGELLVHSREPRVDTAPRNIAVILRRDSVTRGAIARRAGGGAHARYADDPRGPAGRGPARPAELKARFGEPAVALPYGRDWVRLDPRFVRRHMVARRVPVLGQVTCHRRMLAPLRSAMAELRRRGLARLVDPGDYAGCYAPRRIRPGGPLSLHAWGLAVDLNASRNPFGGRSRQDARLVRTMKRHGFTWGGDWPTVRDPMHFEFRGR
jgi:hypothetical protein